MARPRTRAPLDVYLNARIVGRLNRQSSGAIDFRYDPAWLRWEHALPISLSLPLREDRYVGAPVVAVFDNLLPDSQPIRRRMAERLNAEGTDAYSLLSKIGRDCVGALQLLPEGMAPGLPGTVDGRPVNDTYISKVLTDLGVIPLGVDENEEFRISLAGAQEKTALLFWRDKWNVPHGSTPTTHIFKPQIGRLPNGIDLSHSVENEFFCLRLAAAFGLPTAAATIASFKGTLALVIERFDRLWTSDGRLLRLPQEDCCQALSIPPTQKYESHGGPSMVSILELLKGSNQPDADRRTFLKAQIFFWLIGATDGHAKNFSIFLQPGARFQLTPLYDIMSVQPAVDARQLAWNKMKLALSVGKSRHYAVKQIAPRHFIETAAKGGVPNGVVQGIFKELETSEESAIAAATNNLPRTFPKQLSVSILRGLRLRMGLIRSALV